MGHTYPQLALDPLLVRCGATVQVFRAAEGALALRGGHHKPRAAQTREIRLLGGAQPHSRTAMRARTRAKSEATVRASSCASASRRSSIAFSLFRRTNMLRWACTTASNTDASLRFWDDAWLCTAAMPSSSLAATRTSAVRKRVCWSSALRELRCEVSSSIWHASQSHKGVRRGDLLGGGS